MRRGGGGTTFFFFVYELRMWDGVIYGRRGGRELEMRSFVTGGVRGGFSRRGIISCKLLELRIRASVLGLLADHHFELVTM